MPPRNAADFLELAKNCSFLDRKLISAHDETADRHYIVETKQSVSNLKNLKSHAIADVIASKASNAVTISKPTACSAGHVNNVQGPNVDRNDQSARIDARLSRY
jgi:hypothetical protein